ncbi:MAG TPA: Gfo/Idh/MocA family oxidoreductase [Candidatus Hydrogenedentes bacterium]|nr:Gfo/Idh/MocA family oxidoreductase [Candidatus Hydrogenedentota bacterium]
MKDGINRREFLGKSAGVAAGLAAVNALTARRIQAADAPVRVGVIGTGNRGRSLMGTMLGMPGVLFPAVCDINPDAAAAASAIVEKAGLPKPEVYVGDALHYRDLIARDDLDAIIIATYWQWHAPMAVDAMKAGKYTGVEVPAALTFDECRQLVDTHEQTKVPCMMLENWSFRRDNLAVLNMIRQGLLGEMVHCHCAHSHDCIDHWFFDTQGNIRWGGEFLLKRNCDQYPTHSLGPVLSWLDINCGDAFDYCTSAATDSRGINAYFRRKFGPDHPNAQREYKQGDIVTSLVRTKKGKTIVINYDMQLPRPYDNRWTVQGTLGLYNEQRDAVYIEGRSPKYHEWESFPPYQAEFDHAWWKAMEAEANAAGHGGTDYLELSLFLKAVREKGPTPIDVYDSVTMSSLIPLSEASIAQGSAPVPCHDYTRGQWATRKPAFAVA